MMSEYCVNCLDLQTKLDTERARKEWWIENNAHIESWWGDNPERQQALSWDFNVRGVPIINHDTDAAIDEARGK